VRSPRHGRQPDRLRLGAERAVDLEDRVVENERAMNEQHLKRCASAEWAGVVRNGIIPWVLEGIELGDDVLEVGPGPGMTTDVLRERVPRLTAVELDPDLAGALSARLDGGNVEVICADATDMPLPAGRFSAAVCLTMLHHVPTAELQDRLLVEVRRVLASGAMFVGEDSLETPERRELHEGDIYNPVDPAGLEARLQAAGFEQIEVSTNDYALRFRARRPA
jgi:SAM-dependent methyltransferase